MFIAANDAHNKIYPKVDIAIFSGFHEELEYFMELFSAKEPEKIYIDNIPLLIYEYHDRKIALIPTGIGTVFAANTITLAYQQLHPDFMFYVGTAGGIDPSLNVCDVIIAEDSFEAEIQPTFAALKNTPFESCLTHPLINQPILPFYKADAELLEIATAIQLQGMTTYQGTVVTTNTFPAPQYLFDNIKIHKPFAIDMETSAFYQTAWLLGAKALAIRGISNVLNHDGSDDNIHASDVKGSAKAASQVLHKILDALIFKHLPQKKQNPSTNHEADALIKLLKLMPHPEGGYFAEVFKSTDKVKPLDNSRYNNEDRSAGTAIYYLLKGRDFSAWHRLKSDEIWHYYKGCPITIYVLDPEQRLTTHVLGDPIMHANASFQVAIKSGHFFAAMPVDPGSYTLVGCTVSPGFEYTDFHLANREELLALFPRHADLIKKLSRMTTQA